MRVLFVSDNPRVSAQVHTALLDGGDTEVFEVRTPQRAVALLDGGQRFDLVLGDADTVPSGGFYLAREVKARGQMGQDVPPVVLLLARSQDVYLSNWSQADAYVLKPVDPFDLAEVLDTVVAGRPLPALPGVGGEPTASLLDVPGPDYEAAPEEGGGSIGSGAP